MRVLSMIEGTVASVSIAGLVAAATLAVRSGERANPSPGHTLPSASQGTFDPCKLLTVDEVQAALGWKPATTERSASRMPGLGNCKYTSAAKVTREGPQEVSVGIGLCPTNMPCTQLPDFANSQEMAKYRKAQYEKEKGNAMFQNLDPHIVPIEGMGVPAIEHELATLTSIEMAIGHKRLAYVETFGSSKAARALAAKVLARAR